MGYKQNEDAKELRRWAGLDTISNDFFQEF